MAASAEDLAKVTSSIVLTAGGRPVDGAGNPLPDRYGIFALGAFVKNVSDTGVEPTHVCPALGALVYDLANAHWWTDDTERTTVLLPRQAGAAQGSGLAVRIWDSFVDLPRSRQRGRQALSFIIRQLLPDALDAWAALHPSPRLTQIASLLRALTNQQITLGGVDRRALRALCDKASLAARAAAGERTAIPQFVAVMRNATRNMAYVKNLTSEARVIVGTAFLANGGVAAQGGAAITAARTSARGRIITAITNLMDADGA